MFPYCVNIRPKTELGHECMARFSVPAWSYNCSWLFSNKQTCGTKSKGALGPRAGGDSDVNWIWDTKPSDKIHSVNPKARTVSRSTSEDAGTNTPTSRPRYPQHKHRPVPPAPYQGKTTPLAAKGRESREPLTGMCTRSTSFFWLEPLLPLPDESFFLVSMAVLPIPARRGGLSSTYPIGSSHSVLPCSLIIIIFFNGLRK